MIWYHAYVIWKPNTNMIISCRYIYTHWNLISTSFLLRHSRRQDHWQLVRRIISMLPIVLTSHLAFLPSYPLPDQWPVLGKTPGEIQSREVIISISSIKPLKPNISLTSAQASTEARPLTLRTTSHIKICNNPHIITRLMTTFVGKPRENPKSYQSS